MQAIRRVTLGGLSALYGLGAILISAAILYASEPTCGTAVVDGDPAEWNLNDPAEDPYSDFFANMYRSENPRLGIQSKLYLRYDCLAGIVYALVLAVDGVPLPAEPENAWISLDGTTDKVVSGTVGNDGIPPDFAWIDQGFDGNSGHARGWEASFSILR